MDRMPKLVVGLACLLLLPAVSGHDFEITTVAAILDARGGFQLDVGADIDAIALGLDPSTDSAVVAARMEALTPSELEAHAARLERLRKKAGHALWDGPKVEEPASA